MRDDRSTTAAGWPRLRAAFQRGVPPGFFRSLGWQYLASFWTMGVGFAYAVLLGRALGAADFGLIASALAFAGLVFGLVELRLHEAVIRYVTGFWQAGDRARTLATVKLSLLADAGSGILALGVVGATAAVAEQYLIRDPRGALAVELSGLALFCGNVATATATGLLRAFDAFGSYAVVKMAGVTINLGAALAAILVLGWGPIGVLGVSVVSSAVTNVTLVAVALYHLDRHVPLRRTPCPLQILTPHIGEMRRFVASTYGLSLTGAATRDLDVALLAWLASLDSVGVYKIAKTFMSALWQVSDPFLFVVYPEMARLWARHDAAGLRAFIRRLAWGLGLAALALFAAAVIAVPPVIRWGIGKEFSEAGPIFRWMAWSVLVWMPLLWINPVLMAAGCPELSVRAALLGGTLTVVLYGILIPLGQGRGAALAYAVGVAVTLLTALWFAVRAGLVNGPGTGQPAGA